MNKKRVAVFVDNNCLTDNRVIRSSEAIAAEGYEVRVFCRDKRQSVGNAPVNGVEYERNWVPTLYYTQNTKAQWNTLKVFLFKLPGSLTSKLSFCITATLLLFAYTTKHIIDYTLKKRKEWRRNRNKTLRQRQTRWTHDVRKLSKRGRKKKRTRKENIKYYTKRAYYKIYRIIERIITFIPIILLGLLLSVILFVPALILGFILFTCLALLIIDRKIQAFGQPDLNIAQQKAQLAQADKKNAPKPKIHRRLLNIVLQDKSDQTYVSRIIKYRAARIYESTRDAVINYNPDLIHAHDLINLPVGVMLAKDTGAKLIYDAHEFETARDKPSHKRWKREIKTLEGYFARKTDGIITISDSLAKELVRIHKVKLPVVVHNTPDINIAKTPDVKIREEIGITTDTPLAIYVGGLKITRGLPFFLEAAKQIPNLHIAACGPRTVTAEDAFNELVEHLGISDRFHMVGPIDSDYLLEYLRSANFSIMPTQNIGISYIHALPNKFFESMLSNVPIMVGRDIVDMSKIVTERDLGQIVQQDDPDDISRGMKILIERSEQIKTHMKQQNLHQTYGWQAQLDRLKTLYSDVLSEQK